MTDLVVVSLEPWDDVWRRNQYLVSGLLTVDPELRVLFVEPPDDPIHALRRGGRPAFGHGLVQVTDRLWTVRAVKPLPRRFDSGTDARLAQTVLRAARRLKMAEPTLWINDPGAVAVARLTEWPVLYDMTDDWIAADRPMAERARLDAGEHWLLTHARTVVACSPELLRRKSTQREDITVVRNAVDIARYQEPAPRPADLPDGKVALYVGTLHRDRLDVELCVQTARALALDASLVLVGPNALAPEDTALLRDSGVLVLGARASNAVPGYLQHADVLLVPHLVTAFTESLDPIKLYEYQAVGRPVVSTPVAGFRDAGNARFRIADRVMFSEAVADEIRSTFSSVPSTSRAADWSARVEQFHRLLTALRKT